MSKWEEVDAEARTEEARAKQDLAPGLLLVGETTNEEGQTVQRVVDRSAGVIFEAYPGKSGHVGELKKEVGRLTDLPAKEEYTDEAGRTVRTVKDESGTLIQLLLDKDESILDLVIPPGTEAASAPSTHRLNVVFSDSAYKTVQELARRNDKSVSELVRDAIALQKWFDDTRAEGWRILAEKRGRVREIVKIR